LRRSRLTHLGQAVSIKQERLKLFVQKHRRAGLRQAAVLADLRASMPDIVRAGPILVEVSIIIVEGLHLS
jgi:hypothetical protein